MSLFAILTRKKPKEIPAQPVQECPHWDLGPHWDSLEDMGHPERAAYYICAACGESFLPDERPPARV